MPPIIPADLLLKNVTVITMDPERPFAKGVAIAKGKIAGLLDSQVNDWPIAPNGEILNGKGTILLPGLIDAHCHLRAQISSDLGVSDCQGEVNKTDLRYGVTRLQTNLLKYGITSVQDATPTNNISDLELWAARIEKDNWSINLQFMAGEENHINMTKYLEQEVPAGLTDRIEMGPVKVVMDASPELSPSLQELTRLVLDTSERNTTVAIHVVDPEMVWRSVKAIRTAVEANPKRKLRHRLEHLRLCPDAFFPDISELGTIVVCNPSDIFYHGDFYLNDVEPSEQRCLYRMKSTLIGGIPLAAGSDAPVADFNPWIGIRTACSRTTSSGKMLNPEEALSRWQALKLYTSGAALAAGWEHKRGMIRPGFDADLIAIDNNPLTCHIDELSGINTNSVWIRGQLVHHS